MSPAGAYPAPFAVTLYPCGFAPSHVWMAAGLTKTRSFLSARLGNQRFPAGNPRFPFFFRRIAMNQTEQPRKYFDLHLTGVGYLSRVREVTSAGQGRARARPVLRCSICA